MSAGSTRDVAAPESCAPAAGSVAESPLGSELMRLVKAWRADAAATRKLAGICKTDGYESTAKLGEWWAESRELSAAQLERVALQANEGQPQIDEAHGLPETARAPRGEGSEL